MEESNAYAKKAMEESNARVEKARKQMEADREARIKEMEDRRKEMFSRGTPWAYQPAPEQKVM